MALGDVEVTTPVLQAERVSKRFGGVVALADVNFAIQPGEIHAVCGENGAGKSTLIRILSGQYPVGSYTGQIHWSGQPVRFQGVRDAERLGIAVVHQELALIESLTVAENVFLGNLPRHGWRIHWAEVIRRTDQLLREFRVPINPAAIVGKLGMGQKQLVEIARALAQPPRLLILDEPTAALTGSEVSLLLSALRTLRDQGTSCVYISHKLDEVKAIADRVTVLRDGRTVSTMSAADATIPLIIRDMVGREIQEVYPRRTVGPVGDVLLEIRGVSATAAGRQRARLDEISLTARAGEIVGIGGLMGAGRSERLMHVFGLWGKRTAGEILVRGSSYPVATPAESLRRGLLLVTEDRKRFGLVAGESVDRNLSLSSLRAVTRWGRVDRLRERQRNSTIGGTLGIRSPSPDQSVRQLSGGNQQKVVLGRGLLTNPAIVLLDEPTRGVDVGAKCELYGEIHRLVRDGKAVVLVSSELAELMGMCDRIIILHEGRVSGRFDAGPFDQNALMAAATNQQLNG